MAADGAGSSEDGRAKNKYTWESKLYHYKPSEGGPARKYTPPCSSRAVDGGIRGAGGVKRREWEERGKTVA